LSTKKLSIGTAQFGSDYGVSNKTGITKSEEINKIFSIATDFGINNIDTALDYGNSHKIIGDLGLKNWNITTKIPSIPMNSKSIKEWIKIYIENFLNDLNVLKIDTLLFHDPFQLIRKNGEEIFKIVQDYKEKKIINKIGISIYNCNDLNLFNKFNFNVVQIPFNIIDRRPIQSNIFDKLSQSGIEIQIRSIFLQGLLFMPKETLLILFEKWSKLWNNWQDFLDINNLTPLEACLNYVYSYSGIDKYIIGVNNSKQLSQILKTKINKKIVFPKNLFLNDVNLLNPYNWKINENKN